MQAYSVVMEALIEQKELVHRPLVDKIGIFQNKAGKWSGYIHGKAEELAGFDIPHFINGTLPNIEGEIAAELHLPTGIYPVTIVQWKPKYGSWTYRALICLTTDEEGLAYARRCAANKQNDL